MSCDCLLQVDCMVYAIHECRRDAGYVRNVRVTITSLHLLRHRMLRCAGLLLLLNPVFVCYVVVPAAPMLLSVAAVTSILVGVSVVYSIVVFFTLLCVVPLYTGLVKLCDVEMPFVIFHPCGSALYYSWCGTGVGLWSRACRQITMSHVR